MFVALSIFFFLLSHLLTESFALMEFSSYSPPSLLDATHLCSGVGEAFLLSRMLVVYSTDGFLCFLILHSSIFQFLGPFHVLLSVQKVNAYANMS